MQCDAFASSINLYPCSINVKKEFGGRSPHLPNRFRDRNISLYSYRANERDSDSESKKKYVRIQPKTLNSGRNVELQTAVTTMSKTMTYPNQQTIHLTIDLHAQIHFGQNDYFSFYNDLETFSYDRVLYELLVSQDVLQSDSSTNSKSQKGEKELLRYLPRPKDGLSPLLPTNTDLKMASQYGLKCQVQVVDYTHPNWFHADYTIEEMNSINITQNLETRIIGSDLFRNIPGIELLLALIRPTTPKIPPTIPLPPRRLFSNLFLPGESFTSFLRVLLWTFTPSPELSVLLLDWSSLNPKPKSSKLSEIFAPFVGCLFRGDLIGARRLVFAQLLVNGQNGLGSEDETLVIQRNTRAVETLIRCMDEDMSEAYADQNSPRDLSYALMYGSMHCEDLQKRLEEIGFVVKQTDWRVAWSVNAPKFTIDKYYIDKYSSSNNMLDENNEDEKKNTFISKDIFSTSETETIGIGIIVVSFYLLIGGVDWLDTMESLAIEFDRGRVLNFSIEVILYVMRHVAFYLGLTKFVVDWDGDVNLFIADTEK